MLPVLLLLAGCSEPVTTPTKFKTWNAKDGTFAIEYPEDWKADGGGKQGIQWAEFSKGSCVITVDTNLTASIIGDPSGGAASDDVPEELQPAAAAHKLLKDTAVGDKFSGYKEEAPIKFSSGVGDGRKSVFTGAKGLSGKVKGYRVTIPQSDKGLIIFAYGPAKHWDKLQPAYDKILEGIQRGTPQL
jgi:hypothetical protein